jgi:hypothetical protein
MTVLYTPQHETTSTTDYYETKTFETRTIDVNPGNNINSLIKTINELGGYADLKENWDSYGASPVPESVLSRSKDIVRKIYLRNIEVYYTAPSPGGDIVIELRNLDKTLEIEILSDGNCTYTSYEGDIVEEGVYDSESHNKILDWLLS